MLECNFSLNYVELERASLLLPWNMWSNFSGPTPGQLNQIFWRWDSASVFVCTTPSDNSHACTKNLRKTELDVSTPYLSYLWLTPNVLVRHTQRIQVLSLAFILLYVWDRQLKILDITTNSKYFPWYKIHNTLALCMTLKQCYLLCSSFNLVYVCS